MDDWSKVAGIVALATIPFYASPLILQPAFVKVRDIASQIYYRNNKCEAISWESLHNGPLRPLLPLRQGTSQRTSSSLSTHPHTVNESHEADQNSHISPLINHLKTIWKANPRPTAHILLVLALLTASGGTPDAYHPSTSHILTLGKTTFRFRLYERENTPPYLLGTLTVPPRFEPLKAAFYDITKSDLLAIAHGYPPFYRRTFTSNSGFEVTHPVKEDRDIHRAGWVVAIGFAVAVAPLRVYDKRNAAAYSEACDRVLGTLRRLQRELGPEHAHAALLDVAVRVVVRMNGYTSGSGAEKVTQGTVLLGRNSATIGGQLGVPELGFAMEFFNDLSDGELSFQERERLERGGVLVEVVRAAVLGVFTWWQYVNNESRGIPGWLLDERVASTTVWIEDSSGVE